MVNATCRKFTAGNETVPTVQEAGWASGLVWTSVENLAPLGFDPQTIQSTASRYINYAILALMSPNVRHKFDEFLRENLAVGSQTTKQLCHFPPDKRSDSSKYMSSGFGGLEVACWPSVPKFAGSHPAEAVIFLGRKNPQHTFLQRASKAVGPML